MKSLLFLLLALTLPTQATEIHEESITHANTTYRIVRLPPTAVQLVWKNPAGQPYRTFANVQTAYAKKGRTVKFLINAGIFEPGGIPSGLHLENHQPLLPPNLNDGQGNFFLKPNGILAFPTGPRGEKKPTILPATDWPPREKNQLPQYAIQSGPLLLIHGQRHPAFKNGSQNKLPRNGVGIDSQNRLVFAITAPGHETNLWDFAGLFLQLGCQNALFLDGDISQMVVNPAHPVQSNQFGAIFIVVE
jgi:uncharacterized protein YigE (DUF2233 family)